MNNSAFWLSAFLAAVVVAMFLIRSADHRTEDDLPRSFEYEYGVGG